MSKEKVFESIVPPLELCKQLSASAFEDSALVWKCGMFLASDPPKPVWEVESRNRSYGSAPKIPAPTLQEILDALQNSGAAMIQCSWSDMFDWWECSCCTMTIPQRLVAKHHLDNPATAAFKLWLGINRNWEESKK